MAQQETGTISLQANGSRKIAMKRNYGVIFQKRKAPVYKAVSARLMITTTLLDEQ